MREITRILIVLTMLCGAASALTTRGRAEAILVEDDMSRIKVLNDQLRERVRCSDVEMLLSLLLAQEEPTPWKSAGAISLVEVLAGVDCAEAGQALVRLLQHPNPEVAGEAIAALQRREKEAAAGERSPDSSSRDSSSSEASPPEANPPEASWAPAFVAAVEGAPPDVRRSLLQRLSGYYDLPEGLPLALVELLANLDRPEERQWLLVTLEDWLHRGRDAARAKATRAARMRSGRGRGLRRPERSPREQRVVRRLRDQLESIREAGFADTEEGQAFRLAALRALAMLGNDAAARELVNVHDPAREPAVPWSRGEITRVRNHLAATIEPGAAHVTLLVALLEADALESRYLQILLPILEDVPDARANDALQRLAQGDDEDVALIATRALLSSGTEAQVERLLESLRGSGKRSLLVLVALEDLRAGREADFELLVTALLDPLPGVDPGVRHTLETNQRAETIPHLVAAIRRAEPRFRGALLELLQSHLDSFYPYGTPDLARLGALPDTPERPLGAILDATLDALEQWMAAQDR